MLTGMAIGAAAIQGLHAQAKPKAYTGAPGGVSGAAEIPSYVNEFLATADGVALTKAFVRIENAKLRRLIVGIVEDCAEL
jgi:hypothetical protein